MRRYGQVKGRRFPVPEIPDEDTKKKRCPCCGGEKRLRDFMRHGGVRKYCNLCHEKYWKVEK